MFNIKDLTEEEIKERKQRAKERYEAFHNLPIEEKMKYLPKCDDLIIIKEVK